MAVTNHFEGNCNVVQGCCKLGSRKFQGCCKACLGLAFRWAQLPRASSAVGGRSLAACICSECGFARLGDPTTPDSCIEFLVLSYHAPSSIMNSYAPFLGLPRAPYSLVPWNS